MSEKFFKREFIPPEERNLHKFKGSNLKEVIEFLEGDEKEDLDISHKTTRRGRQPISQLASTNLGDILRMSVDSDYTPQSKTQDLKPLIDYYDPEKGKTSIFDGFLDLLRKKGVRVSTPEWLQFLRVIGEKTTAADLKKIVGTNELLNKVRLFAQTTLVKDKSEELSFHEAFDEYFELAAKVYSRELQDKEIEEENKDYSQDIRDSGTEPEIKEQLGITEVDENLDLPENDTEHSDDESVHGGNVDQHNDILKQEDKSKIGGGQLKQSNTGEIQTKFSEKGKLVGGGKGKSFFTEQVDQQHITHRGERLTKQDIKDRERKVGKVDRRKKYETRPDKASMREIIRNLRRIITDVSEVKSSDVDLKRTVRNFARRDFRFDYDRELEKQPEIVLLIDVGGPVDEWSPLMKEVAEEMVKGLSKLEVYLFHNNLYGYVWKPDPKNLLASSYAKPNSLIDLKKVVKKRKKVIVYGDAEMSYSEFEGDGWPPSGNDERVAKFRMGGEESLKFIKKKADSVVWINPVFAKEWEERDDSGTIESISDIIPMHDLTVGGVEDAIKKLMKR